MPLLSDILYKVNLLEVIGPTPLEVDIAGITLDSRKVVKGWLFAALPGTQVDGHDFINMAVEKGAVAILCEHFPAFMNDNITYIKVKNSARALGIAASNFYGNPSELMHVVAVTGTNGKTTIATMLFRLFRNLGYKCGLLSTVENRIENKVEPAMLTTPDSVNINRLLHQMAITGCEYVFMEASSIAIDQERMSGLNLSGAIFSNITHDHLDYHKSFDNYLKAKKKLFDDLPKSAFALVNMDDRRGTVMVQNCAAKILTYGLKNPADIKGKVLENSFSGLILQIDGEELHSRLIGTFNAANLLAVYGAAVLLDAEKKEVLKVISTLHPAEGRFDVLHSPSGVSAIIDYAHTPDALRNVLETINAIRTGTETLYTIVGCGGNRDKAKRPVMAEVAAMLSDKVILTSDNPRDEEPEQIIAEMKAGVLPPFNRKLLSITNRKEAIHTAVVMAKPGDILLVAGKGHEKYQEIKGKRYHFDDKEEILESFKIHND